MPSSSTRQATPGPSSTLAERDHLLLTSNAKKRAGSEDVENARHSKKTKVDGEPLSNLSMNAKDRKKKKKKKKKRASIVVPEVESKEIVKLKSRIPSNKPTSVEKKAMITNGPVDDTKHMTQNEEPSPKSSNKGKGKARSKSPTSQVPTPPFDLAVALGSGDSGVIPPDSIGEVARLKEQLASQDILLQRHKVHLTQHQQALTCQICLDLMHKPFALAPCGHITCYNCLIRWFTALQNPNAAGFADDNPLPENIDEVQLIVNSAEARRGTYLRRPKTCPACRTPVLQRPVEMWGIKAMVAALVNSELIDLPVPPNSITPSGAYNNGDVNSDPWRHIFPSKGPVVQNQANREHVGMYDHEDGGIFRCIDCLHEIWEGVCSGCNRRYPGHEMDDDEDSDLESVDYLFRHGQNQARFVQAFHDGEIDEDEDEDEFWDEEDEDHPRVNLQHHPVYPAHEYLFLNDEGVTDSDGEEDNLQDLGIFDPFQPGFFGPPPLTGIARIDEEDFDEEHESDYGGSFIDDNEEGEIMDDDPEVIEFDASSDEERSQHLPHARIQQRRRPPVSEDEDVAEDDDEANNWGIWYSGRRTGRTPARRYATVLTDDSRSLDEEHDDNEEEPAADEDGQRGNTLSRSRTRPRTWFWSDDDLE